MAGDRQTYLGVPISRPRVAFFDFSSCEGCQLQMVNNEAALLDFLSLVRVVNFREAMTEASDDYDIAFIEGSITRQDEIDRLRFIRTRAKVVVALGSCACFGGVNRLKNRFADLAWVKETVYGDAPVETDVVRRVDEVIPVDLQIFGCPVRKEEVEKIVTNVVLGKKVAHPKYPVCMECTAHGNACLFDLGEPCLGPVTRAGCGAWCPDNRAGCWGCRGPADDPNLKQLEQLMDKRGFSREALLDRLDCFGGFDALSADIRARAAGGSK
jgi:coenzyme F420-reducing hydrogenase gamma subunit